MKFDIKPSTALAAGGIALAGAFLITAIVSPESLDWVLQPEDERRDSIKKEMERQEAIGADDGLVAQEETKNGVVTPTPSREEAVMALEGQMRGDERISKPECISKNQVVNVIGASQEAREGRVVLISVTPDGRQVMVAYRKKTFLGIGSGENQIEGILRRGLKGRFPERLIQSLKVRSDGKRSVRQGERNINVEALLIENRQDNCRWH
jgi:hypothetical protein